MDPGCSVYHMSLPSRERGLKWYGIRYTAPQDQVAPLAGARIEIRDDIARVDLITVAPLAGARIEILSKAVGAHSAASLPSRERGLKSSLSSSPRVSP